MKPLANEKEQKALILRANYDLTVSESTLIKRGLVLVDEIKKQSVRVQIGCGEDGLTDSFSAIIKEVIKDKYDLILEESFSGEELMKLAKKGTIDIFILVIENIHFSGWHSLEDRLVNVLQLITQFKTAYGRPVIAFSVLIEEDYPVIAKIKLATDFYYQMPFDLDTFKEAFEKCLEMLHSFDEVPRKRLERLAEHTTP